MSILSWLEEQRRWSFLSLYGDNPRGKRGELWIRCDRCGVVLYLKHLTENYQVCYGCNIHLQMTSKARIEQLIDNETWRTLDNSVSPVDPLLFRDQKGYAARLREAQKRTGLQDALQTGTGLLNGIPIALGVMDFYFMGGSMGSVVGERLTRLIEYATEEGVSLIVVCCSGGARMQEGIFSLMQMAKISAALHVFQAKANLLYLSVLSSPTTGGVTASFAMLGDLIISEPRALIGFAGRRIIEQALNEKLPDDFQMAEGLLRHGLIDLIVPRAYLKQAISELLALYNEAPFKRKGSLTYGMKTSFHSAKEELFRRDQIRLKEQFFNSAIVPPSDNPFMFAGLVQVFPQIDIKHLSSQKGTFLVNPFIDCFEKQNTSINEKEKPLNTTFVHTSDKTVASSTPYKEKILQTSDKMAPNLFSKEVRKSGSPRTSQDELSFSSIGSLSFYNKTTFTQDNSNPLRLTNCWSQAKSLYFSNSVGSPPIERHISVKFSSIPNKQAGPLFPLDNRENKTGIFRFTETKPPYEEEVDHKLKLNSVSNLTVVHTSDKRTLFSGVAFQTQRYFQKKSKRPTERFEINYNAFLASISQKLFVWDPEPTELMVPKQQSLEKAVSKARCTTLLWVGFYFQPFFN